jgi:AcrR family transcriptional regulator
MATAMASSRQRTPVRPYGGVSATERIATRRERLLEAGLELFGTDGYQVSGVKDICREAGLTDRYFYESFRDTRELFIAVFDRVTDELFASVASAVEASGPAPEAELRAGIETFVRALADDRRKARVIFSEAAGAGPEAEQHMRTTLRRFSVLVAGTARRHLATDVSDELVDVVALSVVGTLERVIVEWQDEELDLSIERIIDHCTTLFRVLLTGLEVEARG